MPTKHISFSESLLGLGGFILSLIKEPKTIDEVWLEFQGYNNSTVFPTYHSFDNLVLSINLLYLIGAVEIDEFGKIYYANPKP